MAWTWLTVAVLQEACHKWACFMTLLQSALPVFLRPAPPGIGEWILFLAWLLLHLSHEFFSWDLYHFPLLWPHPSQGFNGRLTNRCILSIHYLSKWLWFSFRLWFVNNRQTRAKAKQRPNKKTIGEWARGKRQSLPSFSRPLLYPLLVWSLVLWYTNQNTKNVS